MSDHFNGLTPSEAERLAILLEELGEAQQIVGKILRHGYESHNPFKPEAGSNREMLQRELGDVECIVHRMVSNGDVSGTAIGSRSLEKMESIRPYLHHQNDRIQTA